MTRTFASFLLPLATILLVACDEPDYSADPGIEVCEAIVEECGFLCITDPDHPEHDKFGCSFDSEPDFFTCGSRLIQDAGLQEKYNPLELTALTTARGVVVGYNESCESSLVDYPVFCYGCED